MRREKVRVGVIYKTKGEDREEKGKTIRGGRRGEPKKGGARVTERKSR